MLKFSSIQSWLPTGGLSTHFAHTDAPRQHLRGLMPRKFDGLESAMLLFCGSYGALVALLLLQAALLPLLMCLALMCLGLLRWRWPARSKLQWAMDAVLAVGIMAVLFTDSRTGGGSGPYLFLILLFAVTFPLLMEASNVVLFASMLLVVYFTFGRSAAWGVPSMLFALRGLLIAGLCFLSARFGVVLRRSEAGAEQMRRDLDSGAFNEHGWLHYGQKALRQCRLQNKPLSLAYLSMPPDWAQQIVEAKGFVSPHPQQLRQLRMQALGEIAQSLMLALPSDCLVGRDTGGDWLLIMPGMSNKEALQRLEQRFGRPFQINFGPRSDEMFVSFAPCVVQVQEGEGLQDLHARAADIWSRGVLSGAV
jgi:GGDEF domain-containing protein